MLPRKRAEFKENLGGPDWYSYLVDLKRSFGFGLVKFQLAAQFHLAVVNKICSDDFLHAYLYIDGSSLTHLDGRREASQIPTLQT